MKILGIIFFVLFVWFVLFGKITITRNTIFGKVKENAGILGRVGLSIVGSSIFTLIIGLPILGILKLLGF